MHSLIHDTGAGYWLGHSLMVLLVIAGFALALAGAYLLLSALPGQRLTRGGEPLQTLAQRYARGEIDRKEFLRRHDLS